MGAKALPLKYAVPQIVASCIAHSVAIQAGINLAFSAVLLPQVMIDEDNNSTVSANVTDDLAVNKDEATWIASLVTITTPMGSLLTGPLMDQFGRRTVCALSCLPFMLSWTITFFTRTSVYMLYVARVLAGASGGLCTAAIVYVSEISHPSLRPMLLSLTSVFVSFGILLTNILGNYLHWRIQALSCAVLALITFILIFFIPETPSWLAGFHVQNDDSNSRLYLAQKSIKWLYRKAEISEIQMVEIDNIRTKINASKNEKLVEKADEALSTKLTSPKTWKPLVLLFSIFAFQQFSGGYLIVFYATQIFKEVGGIELDEFTSVIILGAIRFFMAILSMFLSKNIGRRPLLISSAAGMAVSILSGALCIYFFGDGLSPVIFLLIFVLFSSYGVLVIPWSLIGELLPLHIRGKGSGFTIAVAYLLMFISVKLFIIVLDLIGIINVFIIFGSVSAALTLFVYFRLPETLGKSFQEVEKNF
ncbi:UNVERIFIED_CONTAM: hypothetical protein PYX00_010311 [Menopon gallinae]|uniref:Major facilitator superfamily (MFS) profile domain-containing protein n=1 Tax=Menopon gallinae TaxID=328185 RepID=A0AAW2HEX6_9NEOP